MQPYRNPGNGVLGVQSSTSASSLAFSWTTNTGVSSDPPLQLTTGNNFIWAHGNVWPVVHSDVGFTWVNWNAGTCANNVKRNVSPYFIFLAPLVIIVCSLVLRGLGASSKLLLATKIPGIKFNVPPSPHLLLLSPQMSHPTTLSRTLKTIPRTLKTRMMTRSTLFR